MIAFVALTTIIIVASENMQLQETHAIVTCNPSATSILDAVCMQDMNDAVISSMTIDAQYQLKDSRDDKTYWVSRLKDGHVWMTQNLDLDISSSRPLTSNDTDLNDDSLSGAYENGYSVENGVISWTPINTTYDYQSSTGTIWPNNYLRYYTPYSFNPGDYYYEGYDGETLFPSTTATGTGDLLTGSNPAPHVAQIPYALNGTHGHFGNYYTWPAAVASNNTSSLTTDNYSYRNVSNNPQNSICPAGWRLPTISNESTAIKGSSNEFGRLNYLYNNSGTTSAGFEYQPLYFVRSGHYIITNNTSNVNLVFRWVLSAGLSGEYWSSTPSDRNAYYHGEYDVTENQPRVYSFSFSNSSLTNTSNLKTNTYRGSGTSIRCVARASVIEHKLTFNANGGSSAPATQICEGVSCTATIPNTTPTRNGYRFLGWSESSTAINASYQPGDTITLSSDKTLYAIWQGIFNLTIEKNGGDNDLLSQTCEEDLLNGSCNVIIPDTTPIRENYRFYGYGDSSTTTTAIYQPGDVVTLTSDKTIYAIWIPEYVLRFDLKYGSFVGALDSCYPDVPGGTCDAWIIDEDPPRDGYIFLGWSNSSNSRTIAYYPGDTVTLSSDKTIYAVWKKESSGHGSHGDLDGCNSQALTIEEAICLQDMNNLVKYSMQPGIEYELVDARDGKYYRVAKLADNNVWLLDNLSIGGDEEMLLTPRDTNTNPDVDNGEFILPASGDWEDSYTEPFIDTTDEDVMLGNDEDKPQGGYYNYCAASAGTYCDEADDAYDDAEYDICPANWRMPTGGNGGEYQTVNNLYDDLINTLHLPLSGRFYGGSSGQIDQNGYFWSSTNRDGMRMYYLNRNNQTISATGSYRRDRGYSMRCVAKDVTPEISCNIGAKSIDEAVCLQDVNAMVKETMEEETTYTLLDARDLEPYRIAKLADDNVWLLDNLKLGSEEEMLLTSSDTNTNPDLNNGEFILPASGDWEDSYTEPFIDTADARNMLGSAKDKTQGGYYNYCAASAGTYCNEADEAEGDAEYDICPANWRMPTGGNGGEYQVIDDLYDDLINTLSLPLSGRFYSGSSGQIDQNGYFWSSTNRDGMRMYYLNRNNQTISATGSYRRDRGYSIRCVLNTAENGSLDYQWKDDINEYTIGDEEDLTFIIDLSLNALISVQVDGEELANENYILDSGSTIINLTMDYLNTLSVGTHTLTAVYSSGTTISSEFIIYDTPVVPNTGSNINHSDGALAGRLALSILVGASTTVASLIFFIRRRYLQKSQN